MRYDDMLNAKKLAGEFIESVNQYQNMYGKKHRINEGVFAEASPESGLVRHWSVILTRALAQMRKPWRVK